MSAAEHIHPDQLSLFDNTVGGRSAAFGTRARRRPGAAPFVPGPEEPEPELQPQHDWRQLQLLVNPTEHQARIQRSTDTGAMKIPGEDYSKPSWTGDTPNRAMQYLWEQKEVEARAPKATLGHGAGLYDMLASGEQVENPIHVNIHDIHDSRYDTQHEGHHRIAAGAALERDIGRPGSVWMPITYNGRTSYGNRGEQHLEHGETRPSERGRRRVLKRIEDNPLDIRTGDPDVKGGGQDFPFHARYMLARHLGTTTPVVQGMQLAAGHGPRTRRDIAVRAAQLKDQGAARDTTHAAILAERDVQYAKDYEAERKTRAIRGTRPRSVL